MSTFTGLFILPVFLLMLNSISFFQNPSARLFTPDQADGISPFETFAIWLFELDFIQGEENHFQKQPTVFETGDVGLTVFTGPVTDWDLHDLQV